MAFVHTYIKTHKLAMPIRIALCITCGHRKTDFIKILCNRIVSLSLVTHVGHKYLGAALGNDNTHMYFSSLFTIEFMRLSQQSLNGIFGVSYLYRLVKSLSELLFHLISMFCIYANVSYFWWFDRSMVLLCCSLVARFFFVV